MARELLPAALTAESAEQRRGLWAASRARVQSLESELREVVATAPDDEARLRAGRLGDSVAAVRTAMDADAAAASTGAADTGESLGAARQAQGQVETALRGLELPPTAP